MKLIAIAKLAMALRDLSVPLTTVNYMKALKALDFPEVSPAFVDGLELNQSQLASLSKDTSPNTLVGYIRIGLTLKEMGLALTPENYHKVLSSVGIQAPVEILKELDDAYIDNLISESQSLVVASAPAPVVVEEPTPAPVKAAPKVSAADLFDF